MALAVLCGCQTEKHKKAKEVSLLRVHLESNSDNTGTSEAVTVLRSDPVLITVAKEPILTEANMVAAKVIEAHGGLAIEIQFDESSALVLEQYTAANPGKHYAVLAKWGETPASDRWVAAPVITRRIADGKLSFTPDMSREEADRLVLGLNNVAKKNVKGQLK